MQKILRILICILSVHFSTAFTSDAVIVGNLEGQFGNQLFIIAAATSLALDNNAEAYFPDFVNAKNVHYNLAENYKTIFYYLKTKLPRIKRLRYHHLEPYFHYRPIPFVKNMQISGYYQSEKYFASNKEEIIRLFSPHPEIKDYLYEKYSDIIEHPKTVGVHLRNFLKEDPVQKVFLTYGPDYYKAAMDLFPDDSLFVVFTNDIEKTKKDFSDIKKNIRYIEGEKFIYDFYLMSFCKDNIISNSTFSWWSAYLNPNPGKKVIAPPYWFNPNYPADTKDLLPKDWIVLHY